MKSLDIIKRLYKDYTKRYLNKIIISAFFSLIVAASTASIAYLLDPAIEKIFIEKDQRLMLIIPFAIVIAFAVKGSSLYFAKMTLQKAGMQMQKELQLQIMNSILLTDIEAMNKKHSGKYLSNLTFDVSMVQRLLSDTILLLTKDTLTLIGLLSVMFYQNWRLALFAIIMIPLASVASKSLGKRMGKISTQIQEINGLLTSFVLEIFKNHKIIKIFQKEDFENKRSEKYLEIFKSKAVKVQSVLIRATPIMEILTGIMIGGLIYYAGNLVLKNELEINNFFSFLAAMMLSYQPVRSLATLNMGIQQGISAAKRILPIIDSENLDLNKGKEFNLKNGSIEFKNVNFKYETVERNTLNNLSLNILGGKMTALVGHSGAGKSTIMNLIPRFYDLDDGKISIDEQSIYDVSAQSLRKHISLVSQDTTLFDDTIKNNIIYSKLNASDDEINEVIKLSHCEEFIKKLPNGLDTIIGENGIRLSGGEKQRLSIARAMLKKSQIILLDEATSSLDAETEEKIQNAINYLTKDRTSLVIAHRLSTIINSNKIYVIDEGKVVAEGSHDSLIASSETYKNFYLKQIRKD